MPLDLTSPKTSDAYATLFVPNIIANQLSAAKFYDSATETITGGVAGIKRYDTTSQLFQQYNGSTWAELPLKYLKLGGGTLTGSLTVSAGGISNTGGIANFAGAIVTTGATAAGNDGWIQIKNTFSTAVQKYLRVGSAGNLEVVNSANTAVLLTLTDAGQLSTTLNVSGASAIFNGGGAGSTVQSVNNATGYAGFYANSASGQTSYYFFASAGVETARIQSDSSGNLVFSNTASALGRVGISITGAVNINAPTTGNSTLTLAAAAGNNLINATDGTCNSVWFTNAASGIVLGTVTNHAVNIYSNNSIRLNISGAGNHTFNAAASGATVTINGNAAGSSLVSGSATGYVATTSITGASFTAQGPYGGSYALIDGSANISLYSTSGTLNIGFGVSLGTMTSRFQIAPAGNVTMPAATSGYHVVNQQGGTYPIGYLNLPTSASTTAATTDVGKCIIATGTITIPNATFGAGDVLSIYNNSAAAISIAAGITTMRLAGGATTGARTLAIRGLATVYFVSGTECVVSGNVT